MKKLICTWRTVKQIHPCSKSSDFIGITSGKKKKKKVPLHLFITLQEDAFYKSYFPLCCSATYIFHHLSSKNE